MFKNLETHEEIISNVELLGEVISKQTCIQNLNLDNNDLSNSASLLVLTRIAEHPSTSNKLKTLGVRYFNFESDETVEKLADIL